MTILESVMKAIEVSKRSRGLSQLLAKAHRENLLLVSPTGAEFILAEIGDFDREIQLQRGNTELMAFLDRRGQQPAMIAASNIRKRLGLVTRKK
jgi:hypothetical protein